MIAAHETPHAYHSRMDSLIVHRASRTERLADELIDSLHRDRPENPLTPQVIVIPHAGMRRWLLQKIAQKKVSDRDGIAANFDTMLPWQWLQRTARNVLGDEALAGGDHPPEFLRWLIYSALPQIGSAEIGRYVGGDQNERHRFQLAAHLADVHCNPTALSATPANLSSRDTSLVRARASYADCAGNRKF